MKVGQPVELDVDAISSKTLHGHVESFSGATGAKFALLPPDNATGNFVKIAQRVGVRVKLDAAQPAVEDLQPGLSVVVRVDKTEQPVRTAAN